MQFPRQRSLKRLTVPFVAVLASTALLALPAPGNSAPIPSVRLITANDSIEALRFGSRPIGLDLGLYVASTGGPFELRVSRPDYDTPISLKQVDAETHDVLRVLPTDLLDGWDSLHDFMRIRVLRNDGRLMSDEFRPFCPNSWNRARVDDTGPDTDPYPEYCAGTPLTRGMVWGIEQGWAVDPFGGDYLRLDLPDGRYTVNISVAQPYLGLLGIPQDDARVSVDLRVRTRSKTSTAPRSPAPEPQQPAPAVPDVTDPDPATVPNLISHPAWGISTYSSGRRDLLSFAATEWNEGPAPMVIEGFRTPGEDEMDAFQYFYDGDEPVARANVGSLDYDRRTGHRHWHFPQFVEYRLLNETKTLAVKSAKQSFCLVPTDAVDLTIPNANWKPGIVGLSSACGGESALWIRETLDVGWGDTYFQSVAGQAFNITNVPNGRYFIEVEVNPLGNLFELTTADNSELRLIRLGGRPGHRRVAVPPWHGIDTG
ncbi:MAG: lysyl oxidase family protein [Actinomycetota bacterium]